MTAAEWAAKNGFTGELEWSSGRDAYHWRLETGHVIRVGGHEMYDLARELHYGNRYPGSSGDQALALRLREKLFELRRQHFVDAYARGGYC